MDLLPARLYPLNGFGLTVPGIPDLGCPHGCARHLVASALIDPQTWLRVITPLLGLCGRTSIRLSFHVPIFDHGVWAVIGAQSAWGRFSNIHGDECSHALALHVINSSCTGYHYEYPPLHYSAGRGKSWALGLPEFTISCDRARGKSNILDRLFRMAKQW